MEKFAIGLMLGGIGGALLAANNYKMRVLIKKGQDELQAKLDKLMDEKIQELEEGTEEVKEKLADTVDEVKDKAKSIKKKAEKTIKKKLRGEQAPAQPTAN